MNDSSQDTSGEVRGGYAAKCVRLAEHMLQLAATKKPEAGAAYLEAARVATKLLAVVGGRTGFNPLYANTVLTMLNVMNGELTDYHVGIARCYVDLALYATEPS